MKPLDMNISVEQNGELVLSNERTSITIHPDGTVALSTLDPIQLTAKSLVRFDDCSIDSSGLERVLAVLARRTDKK